MKIRRNVLPRRPVDVLCFLIIGVFLPIVFIFEILIVLPAFHEPGGLFHTFTFLMGMFLMFNIKGNMLACMMIDTSVDYSRVKPPSDAAQLVEWRHCDICNHRAPPRAWHCKTCDVCILKRDHHCLFTGCCIGHNNHRYFICFILYLFIGSTYALVYNSLYLWTLNSAMYANWLTVIKLLCPMLMLISGTLWSNMHLLFYSLNVLALLYSILLLGYHVPIVLHGQVCHERGKLLKYDSGWYLNLKNIFGERMNVAWISPLIRSDLLNDGIEWKLCAVADATKDE